MVNRAKDFVEAFNLEESLINVIEVTNSEIEQIQRFLELDFVFENAATVQNISTFHQLQVVNDVVVVFQTSADGNASLKKQILEF